MKKLSVKEELSRTSYPGRGIIAGKSEDGKYAVSAYWTMGRSKGSRNRVFVADSENGSEVVRTKPFDVSIVEGDASLIIYAAVRELGKKTIVTNGDQTDTIFEGLKKGLTFEQSLRSRKYEHDAPNFTPRISSLLDLEGGADGGYGYSISILKSDNGNGSNAFLLSGELATLLSGRYVEINLLPLSFREYCTLRGVEGDAAFAEYLRRGGMPYPAAAALDDEQTETYLEGIYNTILIKDVELRQARKEADPGKRKVTDLTLLKNIARFLAGAVGSPVSVKSIADYMTSAGRKISQNTVSDYVEALVEPYIFYPVERFDVIGKQLLKNTPKYYIVDL